MTRRIIGSAGIRTAALVAWGTIRAMVFSSPIFLSLFLPAVLVLYFAARKRTRNLLLAASLFLCSWGEQHLGRIVVTSTLIDYVAGLVISGGWPRGEIRPLEAATPRTAVRKLGLVLSSSSNLAFLGFFKYFNFGIDGLNALVPASWGLHDVARVALPVGMPPLDGFQRSH